MWRAPAACIHAESLYVATISPFFTKTMEALEMLNRLVLSIGLSETSFTGSRQLTVTAGVISRLSKTYEQG